MKRLSAGFYKDYDADTYPEIEHKGKRPYMVLLVKVGQNTFALPLRTNIRHNYGYKFKSSDRETSYGTGIDFTKAVVVNDEKYVDEDASINNKEYIEIDRKAHFIISSFERYLNGYIRYQSNKGTEFDQKRYKYTMLKYFHNELGIVQDTSKEHLAVEEGQIEST